MNADRSHKYGVRDEDGSASSSSGRMVTRLMKRQQEAAAKNEGAANNEGANSPSRSRCNGKPGASTSRGSPSERRGDSSFRSKRRESTSRDRYNIERADSSSDSHSRTEPNARSKSKTTNRSTTRAGGGSGSISSETEDESIPLYVEVTENMLETAKEIAKSQKNDAEVTPDDVETALSGLVDEQVGRQRANANNPHAVVVVVTLKMQRDAERRARKIVEKVGKGLWSTMREEGKLALISDQRDTMIKSKAETQRADKARQRADKARQRTDKARQRTDKARQRADKARQRTDKARQRADKANEQLQEFTAPGTFDV
jgi:hypothetical protein